MSQLVSALAAVVTVLSFAVTALALLAWRRSRSAKAGMLTMAFALFALKAGYVSWNLFTIEDAGPFLVPILVFDTAILVILYLAIVKR